MSVQGSVLVNRSARTRRIPSLNALLGALSFVLLLVLLGMVVQDPSRIRPAIAFVAVIFLVGVASRSPLLGLLSLFVWLVALGMTRRLVSELVPITHTDPLLLVEPLLLTLLALAAAKAGAFRGLTTLTKGVLVLSLLALLAAVNPAGGITANVGGLLFIFVPMLGFWIGRQYLDDAGLRALLKLVAGLAIVAAIYGLLQTLSGFPSWDQKWINDVTYAALNVNGVIRPFGMFSSSAEYGTVLGLGIVIWLALGRRLAVLPLTLGALALLVPALVLESARGAVIGTLATLGLLIGARRGLSLGLSVGIGALLLVALVVGLRHYGPSTYSSSTSGALLSHQVQGLSDPLNPQTSTAGIHLSLIENGVKESFTQPAGQGLGAVTIAGAKFGGLAKGTEADPSNVSVAMGLPGLVAYLVVLFVGIFRVYGIARRRRDGIALAALGVVMITVLQWLNGGQYAVAILPWLVLGWADRLWEGENNVQAASPPPGDGRE
jgi:hypothetical protein